MKRIALNLILTVFIFSFTDSSRAMVWDVLEEYYGNGARQVSIHDVYEYDDNGYMVQTLHDGYSELTPGLLGAYPCKTIIPGFPIAGDVTIEIKFQALNNTGFELFFSETNSTATSGWNSTVYINGSGAGSSIPNTIIDVAGGSSNLAPLGFDGSAIHTYRFIRQNDRSLFYLIDNGTPQFVAELTEGGGAATDGENLMYGIPFDGQTYRIYHLKIGSGAEIPEPASLLLLGVGGLITRKRQL
jgi:hypothetical protein